jgi:endonuclease
MPPSPVVTWLPNQDQQRPVIRTGLSSSLVYLELLNRDPLLTPVRGVFAAQEIRPQARVLAEDRGIRCVTLDYDTMRGADDASQRLF